MAQEKKKSRQSIIFWTALISSLLGSTARFFEALADLIRILRQIP